MSICLTLYNAANLVLPYRGCFALRRTWLRLAGVTVGAGARIATGARIYDRFLSVGRDAWIGPETSILSTRSGRIIIGNRVDIGPACMITSGSHQVGPPDRRAGMGFGADIEIGDGTWIGARCTILAGARIGRGSIVAGGAVVRSGQYPDNVLLAGVPAVPKRCLEG